MPEILFSGFGFSEYPVVRYLILRRFKTLIHCYICNATAKKVNRNATSKFITN